MLMHVHVHEHDYVFVICVEGWQWIGQCEEQTRSDLVKARDVLILFGPCLEYLALDGKGVSWLSSDACSSLRQHASQVLRQVSQHSALLQPSQQ